MDYADTMLRITRARSALILEHPFFGSLALRQLQSIDLATKTAATDGKQMCWNPTFVASLNDQELIFVMAHEVMHSVLDHPFRRNGRNRRWWNIAGDYVINFLLVAEKTGKMPKVGLYDAKIYKDGKETTDGIYNLLVDKQNEQKKQQQQGFSGGQSKPDGKPGQPGEPLDDCRDAGQTPAELAEAESESKIAVAQAAQAAKMMGKLSAGLERLVHDILHPKVQWQEVLRDFTVAAKTEDRSYARAARRFIPMGLYAPSRTGTKMGRIAIGFDCSGSTWSGPTLGRFLAEMRAIQEDVAPEAIDVIYFDSKVTHTETFEGDEMIDIHPKGGGGTAFSPVFRHINAMDDQPECCVILTDLICSDFGPAPDYPVLFVTTDKTAAPFGQVVEIK